MKKTLIFCLAMVMVLGFLAVGCEKKPDPNKYMVKVEVVGDDEQGTKVFGQIRADNPSSAGFATKPIEIVIPESVEAECGPANYEVSFMAWSPRKMKCRIYVDGKELKPPDVLYNIGEGSFSAMFELKEKQ